MHSNPIIEILAVGSEMLTPYFQDTNSLFLTERLNDLGLTVDYKTITGDDWDYLITAIRDAVKRSDIVIAMGGLGPTKDDQTREAFASVLGTKLVYKEDLFKKIESRFNRRKLEMPLVNKKQAYIFEGATILNNRNGTAPGLWLEQSGTTIILLPGPPHEIKPMFDKLVMPRFSQTAMRHSARRIIRIAGMAESKIESQISDLYPKEKDLQMTILAKPGQIELRLSSYSIKSESEAESRVESLCRNLTGRIGSSVFTTKGDELESVVGSILRDRGQTVSTAESCTGGLLGHRLTNVPGSSAYYVLGIVAYSNQAKISELGIDPDLIDKHGAVSSQVAEVLARNVREKSSSDFGLGVTGIAGPDGGTPEKPVGLVFTALSWNGGQHVLKNIFLGSRERVKFQSSQKILDMLRLHLQGQDWHQT